MSPSDEDSLPVSHYIAPFYGNFNPSFSKDSAIFFESKGKSRRSCMNSFNA